MNRSIALNNSITLRNFSIAKKCNIIMWRLAACLVLILVASSCGSRKQTVRGSSGRVVTAPAVKQHVEAPRSLPDETRALLTEADRWLGTRYQYGGRTQSGVDCSGLMLEVYLRALDIKLPRNSAKQAEFCERIHKRDLVEGDLVFFSPVAGGGINHVGMYIGDDKIVHSSTSRGVIVSSLNEDYYLRTYHSAGRVGQYHAMISAKDKRRAKQLPKAQSKEMPVTLDPVLQASVDNIKPKTPEKTPAAVPATPVRPAKTAAVTVAVVNPQPATKVAMEEARRKALDKMVEEKIDSICNDFFD